jgi:hypothetical protein
VRSYLLHTDFGCFTVDSRSARPTSREQDFKRQYAERPA